MLPKGSAETSAVDSGRPHGIGNPVAAQTPQETVAIPSTCDGIVMERTDR